MRDKFVFVALSEVIFEPYLVMSDNELLKANASWLTVDSNPGYPCRVSLEDALIGERVLAISFNHHNAGTPYNASGPIFVRESAKQRSYQEGEVPEMLRHRSLSLRGYNSEAMMIDAIVVGGEDIEICLSNMFGSKQVEYIHVHNAKPGCFNCMVRRA